MYCPNTHPGNYYICAECPGPKCTEKKKVKYDFCHILYDCFIKMQQVAGLDKPPHPPRPPVAQSANSVSSHLAFQVMQEEKMSLVFLYDLKTDAIQDESHKFAKEI